MARTKRRRRKNVAVGYHDEFTGQFHPWRSSYDYDPRRVGESGPKWKKSATIAKHKSEAAIGRKTLAKKSAQRHAASRKGRSAKNPGKLPKTLRVKVSTLRAIYNAGKNGKAIHITGKAR